MIPSDAVTVPEPVARLARGALTPVWRNALGGLTFREDQDSAPARFIKWTAAGTADVDVHAEAARLRWARTQGAQVPEVLEYGADSSGSWLVTRALPGKSAVTPRWVTEPHTAARTIGAGLRALHEQLNPAACPFGETVVRVLPGAPPIDQFVVCHGDACAPNTLLTPHGSFAGHVDLGDLGLGDRWYDLAVAAWSTEWNYGLGYADLVYEGYGVDPDPERIAYYRALWDLE